MRRGRSAPRARSRPHALEGEFQNLEIERVVKNAGGRRPRRLFTDGEFRRDWWHLDFLWGLVAPKSTSWMPGVEVSPPRRRRTKASRSPARSASAGGRTRGGSFQVRRHSKRTPKITIPAPSAIYGQPMMAPSRTSRGFIRRWTPFSPISVRPTRRVVRGLLPAPAAAICSSTQGVQLCHAETRLRSIATR